MRQLDTETLKGAARHYFRSFLSEDRKSPNSNGDLIFVDGPSYVMQDFYNFTFKDEFDWLLAAVKKKMGPDELSRFEELAAKHFKPRSEETLEQLLKEKLAIDPDGNHIEGAIGTTQLGNRIVGARAVQVTTKRFGVINLVKNAYWPIYAGEAEERLAGRVKENVGDDGPGADPLPEGTPSLPVGATNPNISAVAAIGACDFIVDDLDKGSTAATIRGRTGAQPADPDAAESGTLLFTLTMSATAFGAASDAAPGGQASAAAITDDSSADATGTLSYCRVGATGTGADDTLDGEAGTSGSDFNFNTLSIVSGSTVSMTSFTVTVPQGATAT